MSENFEAPRRSPFTNPLVLVGGVVGLAVVAFLAFGVFGIQTLFTDEKVDEALPTFDESAGSGIDGDETTAEMADEMTKAMADEGTEAVVEVDESMASSGMPEDEIVTERSGNFIDRSHPTMGLAKVLAANDQRFLRFEDFETDNGPDLNVYLVQAPAAASKDELVAGGDYIDLGDMKGNIGAQNYEIPGDVDTSIYSTVVIWCVRFGVAFGAAEMGA